MKITTAWANLARNYTHLKFANVILGSCLIVLSIVCVKLSLKEPLIIEKACFTKTLNPNTDTTRKVSEIEAFIKDNLKHRFNSEVLLNKTLLSPLEFKFRKEEQKAFKKKGIIQHVIVREVQVTKDQILVNADRLLAVGKVRSALSLPLIVKIQKTARSIDNPYGLIFEKIKTVNLKKKKKE